MGQRLRIRRDAVEWRQVEGEIVALDLRDSMYLAVNQSGAVLWPLLVDGVSRDEMVERLVDEYSIEEERAATDVDAFVAALEARELLDRDEPDDIAGTGTADDVDGPDEAGETDEPHEVETDTNGEAADDGAEEE